MLQYACDWCRTVKKPEEAWLLGLAAEEMGVTGARREVTMVSGWTRDRSVHPFAVHFCCEDCKDNYIAALFETREPLAAEIVEKRKRPPQVVTEHRFQRTEAGRAHPEIRETKKVTRKTVKRRSA